MRGLWPAARAHHPLPARRTLVRSRAWHLARSPRSPARWPDLEEMTRQYTTRVVLAAAHLDNDPGNNRLRNLRSLCQRCHLVHDRAWHMLQRWITYRLRYARGDLFLGPYRHGRVAALVMNEILTRITQHLSAGREVQRAAAPNSRLRSGYRASDCCCHGLLFQEPRVIERDSRIVPHAAVYQSAHEDAAA